MDPKPLSLTMTLVIPLLLGLAIVLAPSGAIARGATADLCSGSACGLRPPPWLVRPAPHRLLPHIPEAPAGHLGDPKHEMTT
ncbi:hypothetical protein [Nocardia callitridis]|uniref:Uncharacterized protein n=1 Tax=Nocardia callitridis TaxID=648753 RepID=A0ABP9KGY8_9NOCA